MRLTLLKLAAVACVAVFISLPASAQSCIPTNINGSTINLACNQVCSDFTFRIPHIKSTDDYTLSSIPYAAYPYAAVGGVELVDLYDDDVFSDIIPMPFQFCFYGANYNQCMVGSNSVITFDPICATQNNAYTLTVAGSPQPLPYNGGAAPGGIATTYYPRASIMGGYQDIDPSLTAGGTRRIEYSIVGAAPCRKFVVSFYRVPMFGSSCGSLLATQQLVLHESTGIVEIFFENKPTCTSWPSGAGAGLAILGIQNWNRDKAVVAPGKNCTQWTESNTGYRFTPSSGTSRFLSCQLFTMSDVLVATADTSTVVAGSLDIRFPNICPPAGSTQYKVVTKFTACDNVLTELTSVDIITVNRTNSLNAGATSTATACGPPSGSITITVPASAGTPPFTYVLDGGAPQISPNPTYTFTNVGQGPHTVTVTDLTGCTSTINLNVSQNNNLSGNATPADASCPGVNNGTIAVNPTNGTGPFTYTLNPGNIVQIAPGPYTFTGLAPGAYTVTIADNFGCLTAAPISATVGQGSGLTTTNGQTPTTCLGANNGTVTVSPNNGTGPYTYVLDGTITQTAPGAYTFTGLSSGSHTITVTDANGCTRNPVLIINVGAGGTLSATQNLTATSCSGASNGSATITPTNGTGPYSFNLDNGAVIQAGATSTTFTNLAAGNHTVVITDASGCNSNPMTINIAAGPALTTTATHNNVLCNGGSDGTITVTQPAAGTAPYEYSLDGISWQSSNVFTGLAAGTYTVRYRESNGCSGQLTETVAQPAVLSATQSTVAVVCNGQSNGTITITTTGGQAPYQYSLDAATWQASNIFNVPAGTYTVTIRDNNNCTTTQTMTVTEPATLNGSATTTNATCNGGNDGVITVTANGGNGGYQYSINAGTNYQGSNIFNVAPGTYTVRIKDALGCTYDVANVVVGLTNDLTFTDPADPTICEGTSTQLQVASNALQYSWTPTTGVSNASVSNPTVNPATTTDYTVTVTLGRCTADIPIRVNVNAAPVPDAGTQGFICYGQTYQLQGSGGTQYTWSPATYLDNPNISNPVATPDRTITYTLSVVDANNCASLVTDQVTIDVTPPIKVTTYPFDTVAYDGDQFQILATSGATDYLWSPATGLSDPTIPNPIVTTGAIGDVAVYKVVASTIAGCKGEGYVTVRVYKGPDFYVPSGFTPNGDGKNDTFYPFPVGIKEIKYFRVFNRWGQLVFQTTRLNDGWNGKLSGKEQGSDVYVWQVQGVTKDNRVITKKGTVVLIR